MSLCFCHINTLFKRKSPKAIWSADTIWNLLIIFNYFHPVYATPFTGFITLVPLLLIVSSCIKLLGILQGRNNLEIIQIGCKLPINVVNVFMNTEDITISCHLITSLLVNSLLRYICFHKQILVILMNDHYLFTCLFYYWVASGPVIFLEFSLLMAQMWEYEISHIEAWRVKMSCKECSYPQKKPCCFRDLVLLVTEQFYILSFAIIVPREDGLTAHFSEACVCSMFFYFRYSISFFCYYDIIFRFYTLPPQIA